MSFANVMYVIYSADGELYSHVCVKAGTHPGWLVLRTYLVVKYFKYHSWLLSTPDFLSPALTSPQTADSYARTYLTSPFEGSVGILTSCIMNPLLFQHIPSPSHAHLHLGQLYPSSFSKFKFKFPPSMTTKPPNTRFHLQTTS